MAQAIVSEVDLVEAGASETATPNSTDVEATTTDEPALAEPPIAEYHERQGQGQGQREGHARGQSQGQDSQGQQHAAIYSLGAVMGLVHEVTRSSPALLRRSVAPQLPAVAAPAENPPPPCLELRATEEQLRASWPFGLDSFSVFICPITQCVMQDPVVSSDGYVYDREAIERWFLTSQRSPLTGKLMHSKRLVPSFAIRTLLVALAEAVERPA